MKRFISLDEFVRFGYLQEVNRQFFHPLGLALEVLVDDEGKAVSITGFWDERDDPEGIIFHESTINTEDARDKARRVQSEWDEKSRVRWERFGYGIQPLNFNIADKERGMNGIKPVDTEEGRKYELHWNGNVTTHDDQASANKALLEKMSEDAGRPARDDAAVQPAEST
ncbi:MAG TPA: hypothetical protein VF717_09385 [Pyrinomonadaceae bacterium]|jgi:hypothetical protein